MRLALSAVFIPLVLAPASAVADESDLEPADRPAAPAPAPRRFKDSFAAYQVELSLTSAGPLRFTDTPDMTLDPTTVFVLGGRLGFAFGDPRADNHRLGLAIGYESVARSAHRSLAMITPQLTYETGHPLVLQLALGYAIASGTAGFASNYQGVDSSASLRWSFLDRAQPGATVSASLGVTARVIAPTADFDYASAYLGGDLSFQFHLGKQGGVR